MDRTEGSARREDIEYRIVKRREVSGTQYLRIDQPGGNVEARAGLLEPREQIQRVAGADPTRLGDHHRTLVHIDRADSYQSLQILLHQSRVVVGREAYRDTIEKRRVVGSELRHRKAAGTEGRLHITEETGEITEGGTKVAPTGRAGR